MSDTDVLEATPIFDQMFAEMDDDLTCAAALVSETRPWEFDYFDGNNWDELTTLATDTTLKVVWPYAVLVETQAMPIVDPREVK